MPDFFYIYPAYLDRQGSRGQGRRVGAAEASEEVTAEKVLAAAKSLGFSAQLENAKQYPRQYYTFAGRVKVEKRTGVTKTAALRAIAKALRTGAAAPEEK
ncbi:MAG TPA: signal recognition particle subunit SRP19/SEC65 family protein [Thermoplasmata archaeon]|nr:signal recognition particle subunit SRP19/SEC65 family protein [Thermoplasmata archaeon]